MAIQRNFISGEIGSDLFGGADQVRYQSGLATCRNFFVRRNGGVANRTGSGFCAEVKDSSVRTYLLKFVFSADDTYLIEAGAGYFRFFREGAAVAASPTAWSAVTNYVQGDIVSSAGVNYYAIAANLNQLPPNATYWYPLSGTILEVPTPYVAADLSRLQIVQSGDIVTITHPNYAPRELRRYQSRWTLTVFVTRPSIDAPLNLAGSAGGSGTQTCRYQVTAAKTDTYEESEPSAAVTVINSAPSPDGPNAITWDPVTDAVEYNVYCDLDGNGKYGFIGIAASNFFNDVGYQPDYSATPPIPRSLFAATGEYPATAGYYQQRLIFAGVDNDPTKVFTSRTGFFKNFGISSPIQDDDAVTFGISGRQGTDVRHLRDIGEALVILTSSGEWVPLGDDSGLLKPTAINLRQKASWGSSFVPPVVAGGNLIYNQARGGVLRDLEFATQTAAYEGRDLNLYAPHLVEGFAIERMDYAQTPHSIIWSIRSDGELLGLTYLREFDTWGWHHHDTDGFYEDVCTLPETTTPPAGSTTRGKEEDAVYVIVRRTINGATKRYVERFASRRVEDYRLDGLFLDSFLTYNGINTTATTVTLSTAGGWTTADVITVTSSAPAFTAGDIGRGITVWVPGVGVTRILITGFTNINSIFGNPIATVPAALRSVALTTWSRAVAIVTGLSHLEGEAVSVLANGVVLSGTVTAGQVTLANVYDVIHVGLPIEADFETLDIDATDQPVRDAMKLIKRASLLVDRSRGVFAGPDEGHLKEFHPVLGTALGVDIFSDSGGATQSQLLEMNLVATWAKPGRVFVRQSDPLPLAILAIIPGGDIGG